MRLIVLEVQLNKNKRVLVTGNLGFIGSWTTISLLRKGYEVIGVDNLSSFGSRMAIDIGLDQQVLKQYNCDINDLDTINSLITEYKPIGIINLAGQAIVPRAFKEPLMTFKTNTVGTLSMLEAARQTEIPKSVICVTRQGLSELKSNLAI